MSNAIENNIKITFSTSELSPDTKATLIYSHSKDFLVSSDETLFDENLFGAIYVTDKGDIVFTKDNADKHSLNTVMTAMLSNATVLSPEIATGVFSANDKTSVVLHRSLQHQTLTIVWHNLYISSERGDKDIDFAVTMTGFQDGTLQLDAQLQPLEFPDYEKSTPPLSETDGSADTFLQNDGYTLEDAGAEKENQVSSEEESALLENTAKIEIKSLSHCARVKLFSQYTQIDLTKMAKNPARKMLIGKSAKLAVFKVLMRLGRSKKMQLNRPLGPAAANLMNKVS